MVAITDAAIRTTSWELLFDAFTAASYGSSAEPGVYRNNEDVDESATFPRITISPVNVSYENIAYGRSRHKKTLQILIDIYATKNKDLDIVGDKVCELLRTTNFTGINFIGSDDALTIETDVNQKIHLRTITATFIRG